MSEPYRSRVYTDRPEYADYDAPRKFQAIQGIIGKRLMEHPKAICSYSGGSDSDTMLDLIERTRKLFCLPKIKYYFINTGLEMEATKRHVRETAERYGVEIETVRPKMNIVQATRKYGIPFISKLMSKRYDEWTRSGVPLTIKEDFDGLSEEEAKAAILEYTKEHPHTLTTLLYLISRNINGKKIVNQTTLSSMPYLYDFYRDNPPTFKISPKCCTYCKKNVAHKTQHGYEMIITGERKEEGGARALKWTADKQYSDAPCFSEEKNGQFRFRPIYFVTDADKAWYKEYYGLRYSDAYEVYGMTRTGCCGCSINAKAVQDLERIRPYEPWLVEAAWNVFGDSYRYRQAYNDYKAMRRAEEKDAGQYKLEDVT